MQSVSKITEIPQKGQKCKRQGLFFLVLVSRFMNKLIFNKSKK